MWYGSVFDEELYRTTHCPSSLLEARIYRCSSAACGCPSTRLVRFFTPFFSTACQFPQPALLRRK